MKWFVSAIAVLLALCTPVAAQTPQEIIRWVYTSMQGPGPTSQMGLEFLSAPAQRATYFSDRMAVYYEKNDRLAESNQQGCFDFGFAIPGNDFDADEIARTLTLTTVEKTSGGVTVQASFSNFGQQARVDYDFVAQEGFWKIDDIAGANFRVSQIDCAAQIPSVPQPASAYCYKSGDDILRLDVTPNGGAQLEFVSWQANYHTCSADMFGKQVAEGWDFHDAQGCVIQVRVVGGDIKLADPGWVCKPMMCGQRAVIDGITFPAATQIDCATWQAVHR